MKKKKDFDCVEMKHSIQQELRKEYAGLSDQERIAKIEEELRQDDIFGAFLSKVPVRELVTH